MPARTSRRAAGGPVASVAGKGTDGRWGVSGAKPDALAAIGRPGFSGDGGSRHSSGRPAREGERGRDHMQS
jgi:hypothetical protein